MSLIEYRKAVWEIMRANLDEELADEGEASAETLDELILTMLRGADATTLLAIVSLLSSKGARYQKAATAVMALIDELEEPSGKQYIRMIAADPALERPPIMLAGQSIRELNRHHVNVCIVGHPFVGTIAQEQPELFRQIETLRLDERYYAAIALFYAADVIQRRAPAGHVIAERVVETYNGQPVWN